MLKIMRSIPIIESDIEKNKAKTSEVEHIAKMMSNPGSADFLKLWKDMRDSARNSIASLDPHHPSLAIEYAKCKGVLDDTNRIIKALTGYEKSLQEYRREVLELNGELTEAINAKKDRERRSI